jgi:hypothetical protein
MYHEWIKYPGVSTKREICLTNQMIFLSKHPGLSITTSLVFTLLLINVIQLYMNEEVILDSLMCHLVAKSDVEEYSRNPNHKSIIYAHYYSFETELKTTSSYPCHLICSNAELDHLIIRDIIHTKSTEFELLRNKIWVNNCCLAPNEKY